MFTSTPTTMAGHAFVCLTKQENLMYWSKNKGCYSQRRLEDCPERDCASMSPTTSCKSFSTSVLSE